MAGSSIQGPQSFGRQTLGQILGYSSQGDNLISQISLISGKHFGQQDMIFRHILKNFSAISSHSCIVAHAGQKNLIPRLFRQDITPHIWLIWFSGTRHAELYDLLLPTFCLLLVATFHFALEVFARQLLLSGIVSPLMSVPAKLSQHSTVI